MALDKSYFDSIQINLVKKKYYNANKVELVFQDIRRQAETLRAENESLRRQLSLLDDQKAALGDAMLNAQVLCQDIVAKANRQADEILLQAERRRAEILEETRRQQEDAVQRVENGCSRMRARHMACIEALNTEWQDFLCGLFPEEDGELFPPPRDLDEKLGAIAQELFSIGAPLPDRESRPLPI